LATQYPTIDGEPTITSIWTFNVYPEIASGLANATTSNQLISYSQFANGLAQGAATSSESIGGIVRLGTQIETASSTWNGADDPTVIQSRYASSTPSTENVTGRGLFVPVSENDGYLSQNWFDLTESWAFTGGVTANAATSTDLVVGTTNPTWPFGSTGFWVSGNATTTGSLSATEYCVSGANCGTNLTRNKLDLSAATTTAGASSANIELFYSVVVPADTLGISNGARFKFHIDNSRQVLTGGTDTFTLYTQYGSATSSLSISEMTDVNHQGTLEINLLSAGTTGTQKATTDLLLRRKNAVSVDVVSLNSVGNYSTDSTADQTFYVWVQYSNSDASNLFTRSFVTVEYIR
jgi:hypothetical protein